MRGGASTARRAGILISPRLMQVLLLFPARPILLPLVTTSTRGLLQCSRLALFWEDNSCRIVSTFIYILLPILP